MARGESDATDTTVSNGVLVVPTQTSFSGPARTASPLPSNTVATSADPDTRGSDNNAGSTGSPTRGRSLPPRSVSDNRLPWGGSHCGWPCGDPTDPSPKDGNQEDPAGFSDRFTSYGGMVGSSAAVGSRDSGPRSAYGAFGGAFGGPLGGPTGPGGLPASLASTGPSLKLPQIPLVISPASAPATQRERVEVSIIKVLMESYLSLVKKNISDSVPKTVMHFMVNTLKDVIQKECVARLYKEARFEELLQEAHDVQGRRARCREKLEALYRVIEVTEQIRERSDVWS